MSTENEAFSSWSRVPVDVTPRLADHRLEGLEKPACKSNELLWLPVFVMFTTMLVSFPGTTT